MLLIVLLISVLTPYCRHLLIDTGSEPSMLHRALARAPTIPHVRLARMSSHLTNGATNGTTHQGVSIDDLPKSSVFTANLPPDPQYPTPSDSHNAARSELGPRLVRDALYTYVRPEPAKDAELVSVSPAAMRDLGIAEGEEKTEAFQDMVAGRKIVGWDDEKKEGIYPWAQAYGGWQL